MFTWIVYNSSLNVITKARVFQGGVGKDGVKLGQAAFHIPSPAHTYGNQLRGVKRGGFALHYCNLRGGSWIYLNASQSEKLEYFRLRYSEILCMPLMIDYPIPYVRCASHEKRFSFIEAKTTVFPDIRWVFTRFLRFSGIMTPTFVKHQVALFIRYVWFLGMNLLISGGFYFNYLNSIGLINSSPGYSLTKLDVQVQTMYACIA